MKEAVWAKVDDSLNTTIAFCLELKKSSNLSMKIAGASCFKVFVDGKFMGFGPNRASHNYARISEYKSYGKIIVVEVASYKIGSFWLVKQEPFFWSELNADNQTYTQNDFACFKIDDRIEKVQRYSYQRCFSEIYKMKRDRTGLYNGNAIFQLIDVKQVTTPILIDSLTSNPQCNVQQFYKLIHSGYVKIDNSKSVFRDRAHYNVGKELDGYKIDEWQDSATDDVSKMIFLDTKTEIKHQVFDFGRSITGFIDLEINAKKGDTVYAVFDEILWDEEGKGDYNVCFYRNTCSSVIKWTFENGGKFHVTSFEPYTVRYLRIIFTNSTVKPFMIDFENPDVKKIDFIDKDFQLLEAAARHTFAQNAVDLLSDCPSRERAGWLSDSWFSSVAEVFFTKKNVVEKSFLENYIYSDCTKLPNGMLHMCYPADISEGAYIPNWAMWYVLQVEKYLSQYGRDDIVEKSQKIVRGVVDYFNKCENEYFLLEDLKSWVFVEWSKANDTERVVGVNTASNFCYSKMLKSAAKILQEPNLFEKGNNVASIMAKMSYNGKFFVDNLVREDGVLIQTKFLSEVAQYYAFWFDAVKKSEFIELYNSLLETNRAGYKNIEKPNVMYGLYMRLDLLMRENKKEQLKKELKEIFLPMASRTGTLWENNFVHGSCNHGFASYIIKWLCFVEKS